MSAYSTTWLRWALFVLALSSLGAGLFWIAGPLLEGDVEAASVRAAPLSLLTGLSADSDAIYWLHLVLFLGLLLLTQWMFLRPRRGWTLHLAETGRPMRTAVVAAALMAMMLSLASVAALLELLGIWDDALEGDRWIAVPVSAWIVWLLWAVVFYAFWRRGTRLEQLRKMARGLIVGSLLELLVATGVFVWNRMKRTATASAALTPVWYSAPPS